MKVLFLLEYYHPHIGGVETLFKSLAEELAKENSEVIIITNQFDEHLPTKEVESNITIRRYNFLNRYVFTFFAWIPALWHLRGVDIIHTTSYNAGLPAWIVSRLCGKKIIITFHEYWGNLWFELPWLNGVSRRLNSMFEKVLSKLPFDKIVAVSDYTMMSLQKSGVDSHRLKRIYNGIDYNEFDKRSTEVRPDGATFQFLYFGRVGYSKGLDVLIKAISYIPIDLDFELCLILPDEPLLKKITELIDTQQLASKKIKVVSSLSFDKLKTSISKSDCVVIPSYSEGFCFAAVETMAIGTPIISSGRGALSEVVGGQHIVMTQHDPETLASCMQRAMVGDWEETVVREFPLHVTVDQYIELYNGLI